MEDRRQGFGSHPLFAFGWDDVVADFASPHLAAGREVGRVVSTGRGFDWVRTAGGTRLTDRSHPAYRQARLDGPPAVGDWVAVSQIGDRFAVVATAARHGVLMRRGRGERTAAQVVAANLSAVFCVFGLDRPVPPRRLERLLVLSRDGETEPVVVLTKSDIAKAPGEAEAIVATIAPEVACLVVSVDTGVGLEGLAPYVQAGSTVALVGASGAGKSTLVNALASDASQQVADVRSGDHRGRHTTTARQLLAARAGGCLIDTPGIRAVGLWDADEGLADTFTDVETIAERCRFRNCQHDREPGCAVVAAVTAGDIDGKRVTSYRALQGELAELDARRTDRARSAGEGARPGPGRKGRRRS